LERAVAFAHAKFHPHQLTDIPLKARTLLALVGPTASGKTPVSLILAEMLGSEIVSADSRQIYRYLDIGTAKPAVEDRKRITHHFVDCFDPAHEYSAGQYADDVGGVLNDIVLRGKTPILVGGSGLYVKAAIDGMFDGPGKDPEIRSRLEQRLQAEGIEKLLQLLQSVDPIALKRMSEITPRRVIRALEVYAIVGRPLSDLQAEKKRDPEFEAIQFSLEWDRAELYERINQRVDGMIRDGLVQEARTVMEMGFDRLLNSLNTVGYKEVFDYFDGRTDHGTMIELIKRNTRRFAKRQTTWFGGDKRIHRIHVSGTLHPEKVAKKIIDLWRRATKV
jgi:tRNA dimethylallyltransferase